MTAAMFITAMVAPLAMIVSSVLSVTPRKTEVNRRKREAEKPGRPVD